MDSKEYTVWDLYHVKQADVLLVYIEEDNPSGIGATLEIGYALGVGVLTVVVCEKTHHYWNIVKEAANITFEKLDDAMVWLNKLQGTSRVYLSGGMKSGWQDKVLAQAGPQLLFFDPRTKEIVNSHD